MKSIKVLLIGLAVFAAGLSHAHADRWTQDEVQAYWRSIQQASRIRVPDTAFAETPGDRPYTDTATLRVYLPAVPMGDYLRRVLWHEAGHAVHLAHPGLVEPYLRLRELRGVFAAAWWEPFAEDFVVCYGADTTAWSYWRFLGRPSQEVCAVLGIPRRGTGGGRVLRL